MWRDEELGAKWDEVEIPAHMADQAAEYREHLLETIATEDEHLMEKYLGGEELTVSEIKGAIRKGTIGLDFVPILCGSAFKNKGVQPMLDAVIDFLPSPLDIPPAHGTNMRGDEDVYRGPDDEAFAALAFKIVADPFGKLTYFRVYSGEITKGEEVYNSTKEKRERLGRILLMHANQREDLDVAMAGDIVAGLGFKDVTTGDTLCDRQHPMILERMEFPEPVIHVAIEPKTKSDQDKLGKALKSLSDEDPTFRVRTDEETGQTIISGMGELHLEVLVDRMVREFNVEATVGKPQVAYRETVTKKVESVEYRHIKQSGGSGQFAVIKLTVEPNPGKGYEFVDDIRGGRSRASTSTRPTRASSPRSSRACSPDTAWSTSRCRSSTVSTTTSTRPRWRSRSPARWASRRPPPRRRPVLLEPIMSVEVVTPEDYMGDVIGDLNSRRGRIEGMEANGNVQQIRAQVPLSEMFGYATDLRSRTQGRATYTMQFAEYNEVPATIAADIVKRVRGE